MDLLKIFRTEIAQIKELEKDRTVQEYIKAIKYIRKYWVYVGALDVREHNWDDKKESAKKSPKMRKRFYEQYITEKERAYWQKACDLDQNSIEYKKMLIRALWIFSRFHQWKGRDWSILIGEEEKLLKELGFDIYGDKK